MDRFSLVMRFRCTLPLVVHMMYCRCGHTTDAHQYFPKTNKYAWCYAFVELTNRKLLRCKCRAFVEAYVPAK